MPSIFEDDSFKQIMTRVNLVRGDYRPQWGKMNVAQMLAHVNLTIESALGIIKLPSEGNLLTRFIIRPIALSNMPIKKGSPTSKSFIPPSESEFQTEKQKLLRNLQAAHDRGANGEWYPHVAFGKLTPEQWGGLIYRHCDHHLMQFGS